MNLGVRGSCQDTQGPRDPPSPGGTSLKPGCWEKPPLHPGSRRPPLRGETPQTWVSRGAATASRFEGTSPIRVDTSQTCVTRGAITPPRIEVTSSPRHHPSIPDVRRSCHCKQGRRDPCPSGETPHKPGCQGELLPLPVLRGPQHLRGIPLKPWCQWELSPHQGLRGPTTSMGTPIEPGCQEELPQHPGSRGHYHLQIGHPLYLGVPESFHRTQGRGDTPSYRRDTPQTSVSGRAATTPRVEGTSYFQGDHP